MKQRGVELVAVAGALKIGADALRGLRVDRQRFAPSALADHAQRIEAPVLMKVANIQGGNLRAAKPTCKPTDKMARSRKPASVQAGGASSNFRACIFENAAVLPSMRLIVGRSTSTTGFRVTVPWRTRCLNRLERAGRG